MNIKSLLLGSAAALVAVSGARAADAVVMAEPEPVDYVRVCDVYGKGFYYIPGTETCLSVGGYVRFQVNVAGDPIINLEGDDYQVASRVRARLNFDAREETELGTLRAFARLQATNTGGAGNGVSIDQAYIQLGGLLMGYRDTLWSSGIGGL
ncbi:porin, partial [Aureimonas pseudogalii]